MTDQPTYEFITPGGDHLASATQEELKPVVQAILAELLEHPSDLDAIADAIGVATVLEGVPTALVLAAVLHALFALVIAPMADMSPHVRTAIELQSQTLRAEVSRAIEAGAE